MCGSANLSNLDNWLTGPSRSVSSANVGNRIPPHGSAALQQRMASAE
jgi:hypothetical protein